MAGHMTFNDFDDAQFEAFDARINKIVAVARQADEDGDEATVTWCRDVLAQMKRDLLLHLARVEN